MSNEKFVFTPATDLLPEEILNSLSNPARNLYAGCWDRMAFLRENEIATGNQHFARRANVKLRDLVGSQRELAETGLVKIEYESRRGFVLSARRNVYRFPPAQHEAATNQL